MDPDNKLEELLRLTRANNQMLISICSYLAANTDEKDFSMNVVANLVASKIEKFNG